MNFSLKLGKSAIVSILFVFSISISSAEEGIVYLPFRHGKEGPPVKRTMTDVYTKNGKTAATSAEKAGLLIQALFAGPTDAESASGYKSPIPSKTHLLRAEVVNNIMEIDLSKDFLDGNSSPDEVIQYMEIAVSDTLMGNLDESQRPVSARYRIEDKDGILHPDTFYTLVGKKELPRRVPKYEPLAGDKANSLSALSPVAGRVPSTHPTGALSGKRIGINAGHGYWWDKDISAWTEQRENINNYIEDWGNWHRSLLYTARYLWNAGADVFPSREWDLNTTELIFNNDNGSPEYTETGAWSTSGSGGYNTTYRFASTSGSATTATATWRIIVPKADYYAVYQFYRPGTNRVKDSQYTINHSGGSSIAYSNQKQLAGYTGTGMTFTSAHWEYMGNYYFDVGTTTISLSNFSQDTSGSVIIADAIRLGGGVGVLNTISTTGPSSFTRPWYTAAAEYWTKYIGAPAAVYNYGSANSDDGGNDWYSRPQHTIWEDCDAHLIIHSNSNTGTQSGTNTFIRPDNTSAFMYAFATVVNYQIKNDVRAYWDATWSATTTSYINYAELGFLEGAGIPGALFEVAYHDNVSKDNIYLRNPKFEDILGRAFYKGVVRYFNPSATIAPLPPVNLRVVNVGDGTIRITYNPQTDPIEPTAVPSSYRIYLSTNGKGFDNGIYTASTSYIYSGLNANKVYYVQVAAVNVGGESMPTETLAVRVKSSGNSPILVVYNFDRIDTGIGIDRTDPYNPKINQTFDYIIQHAKAIDAYGTWFDSADHKAVSNGSVSLTGYQAIVWVCGQQSTADETFSSTEQGFVATYLNSGGKLFVSGAEIAWDLGRTSGSADSTFFANYLKANYVGDDAGTYNISVPGSGIFSSLGSMSFDNGSGGSFTGNGVTYNVAYPDQVTPIGGATADLSYSGGLGGNAAIEYSGTFKLVYMGFPFETITSDTQRNLVMNKVLNYFGVGTDVKNWELY